MNKHYIKIIQNLCATARTESRHRAPGDQLRRRLIRLANSLDRISDAPKHNVSGFTELVIQSYIEGASELLAEAILTCPAHEKVLTL